MHMHRKSYCVLVICLLLIVSSGCGGLRKPLFQARPDVDAYYMNNPGGSDYFFRPCRPMQTC